MTEGSVQKEYQVATFAAGCFWGVEAAFSVKKGVISTRVGYTGGTMVNPTYEDVCTGRTGHAESVEVTYDPVIIGYEDLLTEFFRIHDPTTLNRQGPDRGSQYRSAIFYHDDAQETAAKAFVEKITKSGPYRSPVVTAIEPAREFFPAEEYHQQYFKKNKGRSCHI